MIAGVVLAAGLSRRMGRPKLLLPLDGRPLLRRTVEALAAAGLADLIVVVPPESDAIRPRLDPRLYELLRQSLEEDPDMRSVDLDELAEWAAPVDLAGLGVVCPATESGDAAPGTATVRDGGGAA